MGPAHERLAADQRPRAYVELGLIMQAEFSAHDGTVEFLDARHFRAWRSAPLPRCSEDCAQCRDVERLLQDAPDIQPVGQAQLLHGCEQAIVLAAHQIDGDRTAVGREYAENIDAVRVTEREVEQNERAGGDAGLGQKIRGRAVHPRR